MTKPSVHEKHEKHEMDGRCLVFPVGRPGADYPFEQGAGWRILFFVHFVSFVDKRFSLK